MNVVIFLFVIVAHYFLLKKQNFSVFLLVIILAPPLKLTQDFSFSSHYLFLPYLFYALFIAKNNKHDKIKLLYIILFLLMLISSFAFIDYVNYITLIGALSYILIFVYLTQNSELNFEKSIYVFFVSALMINGISVLLQFLFPVLSYTFLETYYFTTTNNTAIGQHIEWYGKFVRYTGLFFSPLLLSGFSMYTTFYFLLRKKWKFALFAAVLGLLTVSKMFYLSTIILFFFFLKQYFGIKKILFIVIPFCIITLIFIFPYVESYLMGNNYNSIKDIFIKGYDSRYNLSSQTELLNYYTILHFFKSPISGHGFAMLENVFLGDSTLIDLLYQGGLIGLLLYLLILTKLKINTYHLGLMIVFGLGINYVFSVAFLPFLILKYDRSYN